jgi:hypothetical protein
VADDRTYIKVHDGIEDHPKILPLSDAAFRLLMTTWGWCSRHLTDGHVPAAIWAKRGTPKARKELVAAGMVEEVADGVQMHDYLQHQRSAAEVEEKRDARAASAAKANHVRWHVDGGRFDASCSHCAAHPPSVPPPSGNGSHPESDGRSESESDRSPITDPNRLQEVEVEVDTKNGDKLRSRTARGARQTRLPEGFTLADARARYAHDHGMSREIAHREFAKFVAWHSGKGSKHVDWDKAWLTWVLRWAENTPKPQVEAHPDLPEGWA